MLRLDWCSHEAARYAVEHWHYSRRMPAGKLVMIGAWENSEYIGAVIYGRGANRNAGSPYGLPCVQISELVRVALNPLHRAPVSKIVAMSVRLLRKQSPGLRLLISYADPAQGHHGGIYQAMGWVYVGHSKPQADASNMHKRSASGRMGSLAGRVTWRKTLPKHKYLLALDSSMQHSIEKLQQPYPKRERSSDNAAPAPTGEGGVNPTRSLHPSTNHAGN